VDPRLKTSPGDAGSFQVLEDCAAEDTEPSRELTDGITAQVGIAELLHLVFVQAVLELTFPQI